MDIWNLWITLLNKRWRNKTLVGFFTCSRSSSRTSSQTGPTWTCPAGCDYPCQWWPSESCDVRLCQRPWPSPSVASRATWWGSLRLPARTGSGGPAWTDPCPCSSSPLSTTLPCRSPPGNGDSGPSPCEEIRNGSTSNTYSFFLTKTPHCLPKDNDFVKQKRQNTRQDYLHRKKKKKQVWREKKCSFGRSPWSCNTGPRPDSDPWSSCRCTSRCNTDSSAAGTRPRLWRYQRRCSGTGIVDKKKIPCKDYRRLTTN